MTFDASAEKYDRLVGRYLPELATAFADAAGIRAGTTALDVGCGPGGLTRELVHRLGADAVAAVDLARDRAITLCGFVRGGRVNVYTEAWRIER